MRVRTTATGCPMSQPPSDVPHGSPWPPPGQPYQPQPTVSFPPAGQTFGGFPPPPPPKQDRPVYQRPWFAVLALFLVVGVIGSAVDREDETSPAAAETSSTSPSPQPVAPPTTVPPAPVAPQTTAAPTTVPPTTVPPTTVPPTTVPPTTVPPPPAAPVVDFAMPAVVGMDLQSAQNLIQTNGVFLSLSHDLLGSRNQVLDSNWIVCTQNIPPGQQVTGDVEGAIDLGVVKREEFCP